MVEKGWEGGGGCTREEEWRQKGETNEEMGKKRIREEEKEEKETVIVKRTCVNSVSTEAFEIFSQEEGWESCGNYWGDLWDEPCGVSHCYSGTWTSVLVVLVVADVLVSPSSVVTDVCDSFSFGLCLGIG